MIRSVLVCAVEVWRCVCVCARAHICPFLETNVVFHFTVGHTFTFCSRCSPITVWVRAQTMNLFFPSSWLLSHAVKFSFSLIFIATLVQFPFHCISSQKKITIFQSRRGRFKSNKVKLNANNYLKPRSKLNNRLCSWWFSLTLLTVATHQEFHWLQAWVTPRTFQCQFCSQCTSEIQVRQN